MKTTVISTLSLVLALSGSGADSSISNQGTKVEWHRSGAQAKPSVQLAQVVAVEPLDAAGADLQGVIAEVKTRVEPALAVADDALVRVLDGSPAAHSRPLIIPSGEPDAAAVGHLREDLAVMSRILEKAAGRAVEGGDEHAQAMGIFLLGDSTPRRQNMYLGGYGVIFFLGVKFPLVAAAPEEESDTRPADTTWDQTKRELFGPRGEAAWRRGLRLRAYAPRAAEYDAEKVEDLKKELLAALKNASNLREVKPDESVLVVVTGPASTGSSGRAATVVAKEKRVIIPEQGRVEILTPEAFAGAAGRETNLIIRVKKSDVDAFAKGDLGLDQFQERADIRSY